MKGWRDRCGEVVDPQEAVRLLAADPDPRRRITWLAEDLGACPVGVEATVVVEAPVGRGLVAAAYCPHHGGTERARQLIADDWLIVAPGAAGGADAVMRAGTMGLRTTERYIVLRGPDDPGHWWAWLGLGSHQAPVMPVGVAEAREEIRRRASRRASTETIRRRVRREAPAWFASREDAEQRAHQVWRVRLDQRIDAIRLARGGTLEWGIPVTPAQSPIVVVLPATGGDAWEAARAATAAAGEPHDPLGVIRGVRASGAVL